MKTHEEYCALNSCYWATTSGIRLQVGSFGLKAHEYLPEFMSSTTKKRCAKKGAQMGFSESEILRSLHGMIHRLLPRGVLYLFPTDNDVSEFSKSRFRPLISSNPVQIGQYMSETDAVNVKKIGTAMLFLHGARATQRIGNFKKESSKLRTRSVDKIVFDEVDLMDKDMIQTALERFSHSDVQEEVYLSTPTIPDYGIDALYKESDQRIWVITCPQCGRDCCLELDFPECIKFYPNNKPYRACVKCGKELLPKNGRWVAQYPQVQDFEGYWISQLNSFFVDPGKILSLYENPPNGNLQEVYNSKLAQAYIAAENRLTMNDIFSSCGNHLLATKDPGPCAMGVDVGKTLHVIIGKKPAESNGRKKIVWIGEVKEFEDLHELSKRFNVQVAAVDYEPETRKAREFQTYSNYPVYLCDEMDKVRDATEVDEKLQLKKVARTELCDQTGNEIRKGRYLFPRRCPTVEKYAKQMSNLAKVLDEDKRTKQPVYRYWKLDDDHYYHATNFLEVAFVTLPISYEHEEEELVRVLRSRQNIYNPLTYGLA